jgi:serine/threonine-protein kinase
MRSETHQLAKSGAADSSRPAAATLPPDLAREGVKRLRLVGVAALVSNLFFLVVERLVADPAIPRSAQAISLAAAIAGLLLAVGVIRLGYSTGIDPRTVLDLALVYEVVDALLIALNVHVFPLTMERAPRGWSGVAVWILAFPLVIPNTRRKVILATLAAAAMDPLGLLIQVSTGLPSPDPRALVAAFAPTILAAGLGIVLSGFVFRISVEASRARDLGSYRLVEPLGSGGMGEVWRAEHVMLARPAAIKLIRTAGTGAGPSREVQKRFEREARATARLSSPHTVQIYDYGTTEEGTFYYVMELLDGFDLDTLVKDFGRVPPERAIHFLRQACDSLAEAHARGLIHRDIKPANIYVCQYGIEVDFVKVLDFGLVKTVGALDPADGTLTAVGTIAGTPGYMSPEMALGREVGPSADIYSLACVGYWLLTGRPVFERDTPVELLIDHARTVPPSLSERSPVSLPAGLEETLLSCLEKEPERRPASVAELAARLEAIRTDEAWTPERARRFWLAHPRRAEGTSEAPTVAFDEATPRVGRAG